MTSDYNSVITIGRAGSHKCCGECNGLIPHSDCDLFAEELHGHTKTCTGESPESESRTMDQVSVMLKNQVEAFKRICPSAYVRCIAEVPGIGGKRICNQIREDVPAFGDDSFSQVVHHKWNPNYHPFTGPDAALPYYIHTLEAANCDHRGDCTHIEAK